MIRILCNLLVVLLCVSALPACGDSPLPTGPTPVGPDPISVPKPEPPKPPEPPTAPSLVSCEISAPKRVLIIGEQPVQAKAVANYDDESEKDATNLATWSTSRPEVVSVSRTGLLTPKAPGDAVVAAKIEDKRCDDLAVTVVPAPLSPSQVAWNNASVAAKAFIVTNNLTRHSWSNGGVTRFREMPIKIYADPPYNRQNLDDAINLWVRASNGRISFQVVSNRDEAGMAFNEPPRFPREGSYCLTVDLDMVRNNVILKAHQDHWRGGTCGDVNRILIAGAIGYNLGLSGWTESGDVMSRSEPAWNISPLLAEAVQLLYALEPGFRPE